MFTRVRAKRQPGSEIERESAVRHGRDYFDKTRRRLTVETPRFPLRSILIGNGLRREVEKWITTTRNKKKWKERGREDRGLCGSVAREKRAPLKNNDTLYSFLLLPLFRRWIEQKTVGRGNHLPRTALGAKESIRGTRVVSARAPEKEKNREREYEKKKR